MNTKKGLNLSGFIAANPMTKYSDFAWSDAACNGNGNQSALSFQNAANYLTTGELNLMSRFSLNSSLTLNTAATDSDTTSSSTSGSSATNNSSSSLSLSPANERDNNNKFNNSQNNIKPPQQHQASNHLLELQKEIKEEEEEIFADINSLINSRSNLYSTFDEDDDDDEVDDGVNLDEESQSTPSNHIAIHCDNNNLRLPNLYNHHAKDEIHFSSSNDHLNDYQSQNAENTQICDLQNDSIGIFNNEQTKYVNHHRNHSHRQYEEVVHKTEPTHDFMQQDESQYLNDDDEQEQQQATNHHHENEAPYYDGEQGVYAEDCDQGADQQDYKALQAVIQQVTSNLPKPCVFFLEGNCRRSDCKFSHDLSNITCKYWIEGFCFKGELCPFLHSYNPPSDSSLLDDDGSQSLPKRELNPTFVIGSEADFPALPLDAPPLALNDSTKDSINADILASSIKNQILSSNPAVVFKTAKKKRKRG